MRSAKLTNPPVPAGPRVTITDDGAYNAFPGACMLADGLPFVVYRKATDHFSGDGRIVGRVRGPEGGWGPEIEIARADGYDCRDPAVTTLLDGTSIVSFVETSNGRAPCHQVMQTTHSTDCSRTWSRPVRVPTSMDFYQDDALGPMGGFCSAQPVQLPNGDLLLPYYGAMRGQDADYSWSRCARSCDGGSSWSDHTTIAGYDGGIDHLEPVIALMELPTGEARLICAMRRDTGRTGIRIAFSDDLGTTWGASRQAFDGFTGRPAIRQLADGGLICMQRGGTNYCAAFRHSADFGVTWGSLHEIDPSGMHVYGEWVVDSACPRSAAVALAYAIEASTTSASVYWQEFRISHSETEDGSPP